MHSKNREALERRVRSAAEAALYRQKYVSAIDVFTGMGLLDPARVNAWRSGQLDFLERVIHLNLKRISLCMAAFRNWARAKGLKPSETAYLARTHGGKRNLRFSKSGDPVLETAYRTHFVLPRPPKDSPVTAPLDDAL